jgi:hypothetical protein
MVIMLYTPLCLEWSQPKSDGGRQIVGYCIEMLDLPTGNWVLVTHTEKLGQNAVNHTMFRMEPTQV